MTRWILALLSFASLLSLRAQEPIGLAYYDVDRLYDTIPALFYNDTRFTPRGDMRWDSERYTQQITRIASVLDSMRMTIVAISGVETESVVRDLTATCKEDYCYIHRTLNGFDGLDIALLYHGDRFHPTFSEDGRGWLYVEGWLCDRKVGVLVCRNRRYASEALHDCRENHPDVKLILIGRFSASDATLGLFDAHARAESAGRGNVHYRSGWRMRERILVDTTFKPTNGDIYARRWLVDQRTGAPLACYEGTLYRGGYSISLPLFVYLRP